MLQVNTKENTIVLSNEPEISQLIKDKMILDGYVTLITDGACSGNPGRGGYGGCLLYKVNDEHIKARFFKGKIKGKTTNNRAEVNAIIEGLKLLKSNNPLILITDSEYARGVISGNWKVEANKELVQQAQNGLNSVSNQVVWKKVDGHGDCKMMKIVDTLAVSEAGSKGKK